MSADNGIYIAKFKDGSKVMDRMPFTAKDIDNQKTN